MGKFSSGDKVTAPRGVDRGWLHPEGSAYVSSGTEGSVLDEHVSWTGEQSYDVDFGGSKVGRVPSRSLAPSSGWADDLGGPVLILLMIFAVIAGLSFGGLWAGAQIGAFHPWPKGFTSDKTEAGFIFSILLIFPVIGVLVAWPPRPNSLWGLLLLAGGLVALYTLPRAAEDSLIATWRQNEQLAHASRIIEHRFDMFGGPSASERCGLLDQHFRWTLYGSWAKCLRYERGKSWDVNVGSARATELEPGLIYGDVYPQLSATGYPVSLVWEHHSWRISSGNLRALLRPPSESAHPWGPFEHR